MIDVIFEKFMNLFNTREKHPIIVGGFYRSGTSLVRRFLDAHNNIDCPAEIKFFKDFFNYYKKDKLFRIRYFHTARSMGLTEDELLDFFGANFIKLHELAAKKRNKRRWADKNPDNLLYLEYWDRILQNFLFVFVVRNPLDSLSSLHELKWKNDMPDSFDDKVKWFKEYTDIGMKFMDENPNMSYVIRYEDLVRNTEDELKNLFAFVGEKYHDDIIESFNSPDRINGLEDSKVKKMQKISTKRIGHWKNKLDEKQVSYTIKHCDEFMSRFGYSSENI